MNHLQISKNLAKAIGWTEDDFYHGTTWRGLEICVGDDVKGFPIWKNFDYRDEVVAFRIAERYAVFPTKTDDTETPWHAMIHGRCVAYGKTPQEAIAMVVILMVLS